MVLLVLLLLPIYAITLDIEQGKIEIIGTSRLNRN